MEAQRRTGRPSTPAKEGEKATLGIRASPSLKERLLRAGAVSGRSLSAEAEVRLEESFVIERLVSSGLVDAMREGDRIGAFYAKQKGIEDWTKDPEAYFGVIIFAVAKLAELFPASWDGEQIQAALEQALLMAQERRIWTAGQATESEQGRDAA